ncbi:MAG: CBS domain-containing protein [Chloroflexi bacterium]|jgi:acetoin utilization protein AcuB|nr:CBS domain-containing protein [Chloroflexota bacterium]
MLVKDRMTSDLITTNTKMPVDETLSLMRENKIRRLPVVDKRGRLVGIVSEKDLLYASPSPATSLSVYEIGYLLSKLSLEDVMKDVIVVQQDETVEDAACLMADNQIGGLPVMDGDALVGIITETDIFKTFIEMLGGREEGVRLTLQVANEPGTLSNLTGAISEHGGDIVALGTFAGPTRAASHLMIKVCGLEEDKLVEIMESLAAHVVDVREV